MNLVAVKEEEEAPIAVALQPGQRSPRIEGDVGVVVGGRRGVVDLRVGIGLESLGEPEAGVEVGATHEGRRRKAFTSQDLRQGVVHGRQTPSEERDAVRRSAGEESAV